MNANRPRIAVLDDEESVRKAVERLLRSAGMSVETFSTGAAFLEASRVRPPDCLILDLHMPVMGGFEVQAALVRSGTSVPVVIITGHDKPEYRAQAISAGVSAYLPKPIDERVLLDAISAAIASGTKPG